MQHVPAHMQLTRVIVREPDGEIRLSLGGELDMNGVVETERAIMEAARLSTTALTIDLSDLTFVDLFGARTLLRVADKAQSGGLRVAIANPRPHVRRLFEMITDLAPGRSLVAELVR